MIAFAAYFLGVIYMEIIGALFTRLYGLRRVSEIKLFDVFPNLEPQVCRPRFRSVDWGLEPSDQTKGWVCNRVMLLLPLDLRKEEIESEFVGQ